jgi:four helix bundle protein
MQRVDTFEQLEVWQKAHALALEVYKLTSALPEEEEFGLILRMRKAACDIPANIANGFERRQMTAKLALYREARSAVEELRYYFILCRDLGYTIEYEKFAQSGEQLARMVGGLVGSIARVENERGGGRRGGGRRDRGGRDRRDDRRSYGGGEGSYGGGEAQGGDTGPARAEDIHEPAPETDPNA